MTRPRNEQISIQDTPYYHIVSRCVRRTYLCGQDDISGKDCEYRRQWIENRIRLLSSVFVIDICAYAVLSNHIHLVVKLCPEQVDDLSDEEIIHRWTCLFKGPALVQKWINGETLRPAELQAVSDCIAIFRDRLASLSWFMKYLNEPIARQANKEDGCTGHLVSRPREFHPQPLAEPDVTLSRHPAPIIEPILVQSVASQRTSGDSPTRHAAANQNWLTTVSAVKSAYLPLP